MAFAGDKISKFKRTDAARLRRARLKYTRFETALLNISHLLWLVFAADEFFSVADALCRADD